MIESLPLWVAISAAQSQAAAQALETKLAASQVLNTTVDHVCQLNDRVWTSNLTECKMQEMAAASGSHPQVAVLITVTWAVVYLFGFHGRVTFESTIFTLFCAAFSFAVLCGWI